jgi:two-component system sensor histidine kinase GlrK
MLVGFGVTIILMMVGNAFMLNELYEISSTTKGIVGSDVQAIDLAKKLHNLLNDQEVYAHKYLISHDRTYITLLRESGRQFDEQMTLLLRISPDSSIFHHMERQHEQIIAMTDEGIQKRTPAAQAQNDRLIQMISERVDTIREALDERIQLSQNAIASSLKKADTITTSSTNMALLLTVGSLLAAILLAVIISRTITQPIGVLIRGTDRIARGSFEQITVNSRDEIGSLASAINEMSRKLGQINEAKAELTHQILHELQTPLTAILGALHILQAERMGTINDDQRKMLGVVKENADKLRDFSHELLDIAKMEAGMIAYDFTTTDIRPYIEAVLSTAKTGAARKNIKITTQIDQLPEINVDVQKLSVVLNNLMSNAIKYTQANGTVEVHAGPADGFVQVSVRDSGIGIPEQDLPRLFTKFYQASNASLSGSKGTGIGLALVKAFVEGHAGKVSVTSVLGKGSTFVVQLPLNGQSHIHQTPS